MSKSKEFMEFMQSNQKDLIKSFKEKYNKEYDVYIDSIDNNFINLYYDKWLEHIDNFFNKNDNSD